MNYQQGSVYPSLPTSYGQPPQQQQQTYVQPPTPTVEKSKIGYYIAAGIFTIIFLMALGIIPNPLASETVTGSGSGSGSGSTGSGSTGSGSTGSGSTGSGSTGAGSTGSGSTGSGSTGSGSTSTTTSTPKIYRLPPIYYSEQFGSNVNPFGGKMRQSTNNKAYILNAGCPAGTSVIPLLNAAGGLNPNGPKAGYYAHPLNKNTPKGGNASSISSCPTTMAAGARKLFDNNVNYLNRFANIGADGTVTIDNSDLNKIWDYAPCDGYYKTLELGLSCAANGIDPGVDASSVTYTPTTPYPNFQGFVNRRISRW